MSDREEREMTDEFEIKELKKKLLIFSDDLDKAGNDLFMQEGRIKDLEYQLEQQKIMNPISVNMVATISDYSKRLALAELEVIKRGDNFNKVKEKLGVAVEALYQISKDTDSARLHSDDAIEALEKIGEMK